jgi:malonate transporter and related proteins
MFDILSIIAPIYISIFLGYFAVRNGMIAKGELKVFGTFVLKFALPALVFNALSQRPIAEILNTSYLVAFLLASLVSLSIGYAFSRSVLKESIASSTFNAMGVSCSNSGFIGFPMLLLIVPDVAGVAFALNVIVENLVMIPLILFMAEQTKGESQTKGASQTKGESGNQVLSSTFIRLLNNPLIIALFAGFTVSFLHIPLPSMITQTVSMFSMASGALSLFIIGGSLVGISLSGMKHKIYPVVVGKLVLHPMLALLSLWILALLNFDALDPHLRQALIVMAAIPMMGSYTILAQAYGQERNASAIMLVTTAISFFTLSGLLLLLG